MNFERLTKVEAYLIAFTTAVVMSVVAIAIVTEHDLNVAKIQAGCKE